MCDLLGNFCLLVYFCDDYDKDDDNAYVFFVITITNISPFLHQHVASFVFTHDSYEYNVSLIHVCWLSVFMQAVGNERRREITKLYYATDILI